MIVEIFWVGVTERRPVTETKDDCAGECQQEITKLDQNSLCSGL